MPPGEKESSETKKREITAALMRLEIMPQQACQIILHCADGKVSSIELAKLKLA
jgi:hypothetical protein